MFNLLICRTPTFTTRQLRLLRSIAYCYFEINAQLYDLKDRSNHMFVSIVHEWFKTYLIYDWNLFQVNKEWSSKMKYYTLMGAKFNEWRKIISYFSYLFNDCKSAIFLIRSENANQVMMVKGINEINCHWDFGTIISFFPNNHTKSE